MTEWVYGRWKKQWEKQWSNLRKLVERVVGWLLPWIIRLSLKRGLRGVWLVGDVPELPTSSFVIAANHHSWWDVYLAWLVSEQLDRPTIALMDPEQLERFPFFRQIGVLATDEIRTALRRLRAGEVLIVFAEGELRAVGPTGPLERGVDFFSRAAQVPVLPVAMRVTLRGAQKPEAYLAFRAPISPHDGLRDEVAEEIDAALLSIERCLAQAHPEDVPEGVEPWLEGSHSTRDRKAWWEAWWRRS